jgi:integrin beta 3
VLYRGIFKEGSEYEQGDMVTWGGSTWVAQSDTKAKPGDGEEWRLAVKKGRDGKDGDKGAPGEKGERGMPGKDGLNGRDLR